MEKQKIKPTKNSLILTTVVFMLFGGMLTAIGALVSGGEAAMIVGLVIIGMGILFIPLHLIGMQKILLAPIFVFRYMVEKIYWLFIVAFLSISIGGFLAEEHILSIAGLILSVILYFANKNKKKT